MDGPLLSGCRKVIRLERIHLDFLSDDRPGTSLILNSKQKANVPTARYLLLHVKRAIMNSVYRILLLSN